MPLGPVSRRAYRTFGHLNRLPFAVRYTSVAQHNPLDVRLAYHTLTAIDAYHVIKSSSTRPAELPNAPSAAYTAVTHPIPDPTPSSRTRETLALAKEYILPVYARPPIVLDHGKGCWVWDCDGRKYLDFTAGIAVNALGHADEGVSEVSYNLLPKNAPRPVMR
jgi:Aminotransferase class-III